MRMNDYQEKAMETCLPSSANPLYMLFEIGEEVGELYGKFSKPIRKKQIAFDGNQITSHMSSEEYAAWIESVLLEMGDIYWGLAGLAKQFGFSSEFIAEMNLQKLSSRKERKVIEGNGDYR